MCVQCIKCLYNNPTDCCDVCGVSVENDAFWMHPNLQTVKAPDKKLAAMYSIVKID